VNCGAHQFSAKSAADASKLRGGYYTPPQLAEFIASWVCAAGPRILEPSCGDGAVLRYLTARVGESAMGIELVPSEATAASAYGRVINDDFFSWVDIDRTQWDGVAGNPPYIRFGNWDDAYRNPARRFMQRKGLQASGLMNAWVPFVVAATTIVRPGGRVGLVLPAELLQVGYASELRGYLVEKFTEITLVAFKRLVFDGVLQEVVLFLGIVGQGPAKMKIVHADDAASLRTVTTSAQPAAPALLHDTEKWVKYFLEPSHVSLLRQVREEGTLRAVGNYADVEVGIVTGRNSFFTMTKVESDERGLSDLCVPLVARSAQLAGLQYTHVDLKGQLEDGVRALLLVAQDNDGHDEALREYIRAGEAAGIHLGYKCSIRSQWWSTPSYWIPDAFMLRQIHSYPKIISNDTSATSTDTVHRVRAYPGTRTAALAAAAFNSATFVYSEVIGRSYGGGIHELEPREATALPIVAPDLVPADLPALIDERLRARDPQGALQAADEALLIEGLGWSWQRVLNLRGAWVTLRERRFSRGRRSSQGREVPGSRSSEPPRDRDVAASDV
jgi:adenine-specific DNA methylase